MARNRSLSVKRRYFSEVVVAVVFSVVAVVMVVPFSHASSLEVTMGLVTKELESWRYRMAGGSQDMDFIFSTGKSGKSRKVEITFHHDQDGRPCAARGHIQYHCRSILLG